MHMRAISLMLILLFALAAINRVTGETFYLGCAEDLVSQAKRENVEAGYAPRTGGYCDGAAPELHAGRLELRSATIGTIYFEDDGLVVYVDSEAPYILRGWDLREQSRYRLDGPMQHGRLRVSIKEAIEPLDLQPHDLGLYAWRDDGPQRIYSPVRTAEQGASSFIFRYPGKIVEITRNRICPCGNTNPCEIADDSYCETLTSERNIRSIGDTLLTLRLNQPPPTGRYSLSLIARGTRPDPVSLTIDVEF